MSRTLAVLSVVIATPFLTAGSCTTANTPEPIVRVVEVRMPVPVACAKRPPAATYPDTDAALRAAVDLYARVQLLMAGRELRIAQEKRLWAGYEGCPP